MSARKIFCLHWHFYHIEKDGIILCSGGHCKQHLYFPSSHLGFFNLQEIINLGKFLKSDQFQFSGLTSVAIQFHRLIYKTLIGLIMTTDLEFVKKFTRPYFRPQEFYTLKTRKSRLFLPAINSKNASLSVIWPPFG